MREIGTKILVSHIMNLHIKRPKIPRNLGIFKKANFYSLLRKIADKKTAYNEVRLYAQIFLYLKFGLLLFWREKIGVKAALKMLAKLNRMLTLNCV